jgi:transcriptional regulator with XRE-family HTH domain
VLLLLDEKFGAVLAEYRQRAGMSQMKLAAKARLHLNAVGNLERGKRKPTLHTVILLSRALGVPASELVAAVEERLAKPSRKG